MKRYTLALVAVCLSFAAVIAHAQSEARSPDHSGWSGAAGVGPLFFSKYSGGTETKAWLLPLVSATYADNLYIEPLRAGFYVAGSSDRKMGLGFAVEPRSGFHATDGNRLAGMNTRRGSLEGGPSFDWDTGIVVISASYFGDLTHSSRGTSSRLYFYRDCVKNEKWKVGAFVGADHLSGKVANYFYGVEAVEATSSRPVYQPGSGTNGSLGFDGTYRLNAQYSVLFGMHLTHLGSAFTNSPIVETSWSHAGWIGFAWNLR